MSFALVLLSIPWLGAQADGNRPDAESLFNEYRLSFNSGHVVLSYTVEKSGQTRREGTYSIWYSGKQYRCDHAESGKPLTRVVYCENCERENHYVHLDAALLRPESRSVPLTVQLMKSTDGGRLGADFRFDPKLVGVGPSSPDTYGQIKLSDLLCRTDRTKPTWEKTLWRGKNASKMAYQMNGGASFHWITFVPEMANSIVKREFEVRSQRPDGTSLPIKLTMECELAQFGVKGLWYPREVHIRHRRGDAITEDSKLVINEAKFNEAIPASTFTLAGMDIPVGTEVNLLAPGASGHYIFDGKTIARGSSPMRLIYQDKPPSEPGAWSRSWFSILSITLGAMAILAFGLFFYRARSASAKR